MGSNGGNCMKRNQEHPDLIRSRPDSPEDIDDFARALLDRKAELTLFPENEDLTTSSLQSTMNDEQRRQAEDTMLSALDQLRRSRGQLTIEEEEARYRRENPPKPEKEPVSENQEPSHKNHKSREQEAFEKEEVIDTASIRKAGAASLQAGHEPEPVRYEKKNREDHFEPCEKRPKGSKKQKVRLNHSGRAKKIWIGLLLVLVIGGLFAGYAWKVSVYDPAHVITQEQQQAYDQLVAYADEYPMMSQGEKNELLSMQAQIDALNSAQNEQMQAYFADHTGKTLDALFTELSQARQSEMENPDYLALLDFAHGYGQLDEADKAAILDWQSVWNGLSELQKEQISQAMEESAGSGFDAQLAEQKSLRLASLQAQKEQLQGEIDALSTDRDNYLEFLEEENQSADSDDVIAQYNASIASLQQQMQALDEQIANLS